MRTALFIMAATIVGILVQAARPVLSDEVISIHHRDDQKFDVICKNKSFEVVSDVDLKLNNVCPRKIDSQALAVASLDYRADGSFSVLCANREFKIASRDEVLGGACR